jgi:hypothetical protein
MRQIVAFSRAMLLRCRLGTCDLIVDFDRARCRVQGAGCRVQGAGCRVQHLRFEFFDEPDRLTCSEVWNFQGQENACRFAGGCCRCFLRPLSAICASSSSLVVSGCSRPRYCPHLPRQVHLLRRRSLITRLVPAHSCAVLVPGAREADGAGYFEVDRLWVFAVKVK